MALVIPPEKELILPVAQQSAEIDMEPDKIRNLRKIAMAALSDRGPAGTECLRPRS